MEVRPWSALGNQHTNQPTKSLHFWSAQALQPIHFLKAYDKVSANTASSEPKTAKFKSDHRVVKEVLNTY